MKDNRGFTLIELMVSVGLFAIVMLLTSGAYLTMISVNRQVQAVATGINNLSFALETMTRTIRTGTNYQCPAIVGTDCPNGDQSFSVTDATNKSVAYSFSNGSIYQNNTILTDPSSVTVTSLVFYVSGASKSDNLQPYVTIIITGNVSAGPGKPAQQFTVETGATMRGSDI